MKEKLYTIPMNDAVDANDECPFCFIERKAEQDTLDFTLGSSSSYMESDIREQTDKAGFCRMHMKKMFDYGNTLGNGLILKTHYDRILKEMKEQFQNFAPKKTSVFEKIRRQVPTAGTNQIHVWTLAKDTSCFICKGLEETMQRYMETFFAMYQKDAAFREKVRNSKGFCLSHFGQLCSYADTLLSEKEKSVFYPEMFRLMEKNFARLTDEIEWLTDKFDYRNRDADWKNSKDALQRGMQKLRGGYPEDPVYRSK